MKMRILIMDDHGIVRAGLRALLNNEPDMQVVGEVADSAEALVLMATLQPDIVLTDLCLPDRDGIDVTRTLLAAHPTARVLILSVHDERHLVAAAVDAGASGYIVKRATGAELVGAIRIAMRGDLYVHPSILRALMSSGTVADASSGDGQDILTSREVQVLRMIASGHTNRQIAEHFALSVRTIESHRAHLRAKLRLRTRAQIVEYAAAHGLLSPLEG